MVEKLSDKEILEWLPRFRRISRNYAIFFARKCQRIDAEHLESVGFEQAWKSLQSWRSDGGSDVTNFVKRGIWGRIKTELNREMDLTSRYVSNLETWQYDAAANCTDERIEHMDNVQVGQQLMKLLREVVPKRMQEAMTRRLFNGEKLDVIGRDLGITREGVRQRVATGLRLIRAAAIDRGMFKSLHEPREAAALLA